MNPELKNVVDWHDDPLGLNLSLVDFNREHLAELTEAYASHPSDENELELLKASQDLNNQFDEMAKTVTQTDFSSLEKIAMIRTVRIGESQKTSRQFNKTLGSKLFKPADFVIACNEENFDEIEDAELLEIISDYFRRERQKDIGTFLSHFRSEVLPRHN